MSNIEFELAGMSDDEGNLGRNVPHGHVLVPGTIELAGDTLRWEYTEKNKFVELDPCTLNQFAALWCAEPRGILKFAKKWGILAMQHLGDTEPVTFRLCACTIRGSDPLAAWRYFSRRVSAILKIAAALRQGRLGDL